MYMGRRARYPTPEEIVARYKSGIDYAKDKWVSNAKKAAEKWYTAFAAYRKERTEKLGEKAEKLKEVAKVLGIELD